MNHFEIHECLTAKDQLYLNLKSLCESQHLNVLDFIPMTFIFDMSDNYGFGSALTQFTNLFNLINRHKELSCINSKLPKGQ